MKKKKKKASDPDIETIKKAFEGGTIILGAEETTKALRSGEVAKVYVAQNISVPMEQDIRSLCEVGNTSLVKLPYPSDEVGMTCRKPFSVSVLGIKKDGSN